MARGKDNPRFTDNEVIALMHEDSAMSFRKLSDYIEKWKLNYVETIELLRELADEHDAQRVVVELRQSLKSSPNQTG